MSGAMREKDGADYDLERLTELFDQALTSDDPRVKNALRQLMMIVVLTSEDHEDRDNRRLTGRLGPMRRMQEDLRDLMRAVQDLKHEMETLRKQAVWGGVYRQPGAGDTTWPNVKDSISGTGTNAIAGSGYWLQRGIIDNAKYDAQISDDDLRDLNISINSAPKGLFDK